MEKILEILNDIHGDVDFENEKALVDDGILDSFDVVAIVSELVAEYDIDITINDIIPENFNSAKALYALIKKLEDEE